LRAEAPLCDRSARSGLMLTMISLLRLILGSNLLMFLKCCSYFSSTICASLRCLWATIGLNLALTFLMMTGS